MPIILNEVLSVNETCELLGITRPTFYALCKKEGIEPRKYNGCSFIPKEKAWDWSMGKIVELTYELEERKKTHTKYFGD